MGRRTKVLLAVLGVVLVAGAGGGVWLTRQLNPPGPAGEEVRVAVAPGTSVAGIAAQLEDEDVLTSSRLFRFYLKVKGAEGGFQAGEYILNRDMAMASALRVLRAGPEIAYSKLTVPEGFTLEEMAGLVEELPGLDGEKFLELARSGAIRSQWQPEGVPTLEGLLFPDTYLIADTEGEGDVLRRLLARFDEVAADVGLAAGPRPAGLDPYQTIVAASLVETEAKVDEDRPLIASVIENRLGRGMRLQIDATVLYALGRHKSRVLFEDLEVDSPYNTYRVDGLPPTPIGASGRASLEAMLDPAETDFLYYVLFEENGKHAFAATPAEFERLKAESRRRGVR